MDVRGKDTAWVIATLNNSNGFTFSRSITVLQDPQKSAFMGDLSIATGALQWWDTDVASPLAKRVCGSMAPTFVMLSWGPDEFHTVCAASRNGGSVVASDWARNIDVLSAFYMPPVKQKAPAVPPPPATGSYHTVTDAGAGLYPGADAAVAARRACARVDGPLTRCSNMPPRRRARRGREGVGAGAGRRGEGSS